MTVRSDPRLARAARTRWHLPDVPDLVCEGHGQGEDVYLCRACTKAAAALLADVPPLVVDLELAQTRQTAWVQGGTPWSAVEESALPFDQRASRALDRLALALGSASRAPSAVAEQARLLGQRLPRLLSDETLPGVVAGVARAVRYGYAVIERPPEAWYYGPCPGCGDDLYDERKVPVVSCACGYAAALAEHQLACLDAGEDRLLTVTELVGAITAAGEVVTRDQINGWIRRGGLARNRDNRPAWRSGVLVTEEVWVYRLGDVRTLAAQAEGWRAAS